MRRRFSLFPFLIFLVSFSSPTFAFLSRPISQQFPPVARINHTYLFTLDPSTFSPSATSYNATNLPTWLEFDPNGTFYGTPSSSDSGGCTVYVTGLDEDGNDADDTDSFYLAVSSLSGAKLTDPVIDQLNSSSITSAFPYPSFSSPCYPGFRIPPGWSFSLGFQWYTITAPTKVYYSATLSDGSPLPPWLKFDPDTITFDGVSPWPETELESFHIILGGSDVKGFMDVEQEFNICVSAHALEPASAGNGTVQGNSGGAVVNLTAGEEISVGAGGNESFWSSVWSGFTLDGSSLHSSDVANITLDTNPASDWLTFYPSNTSLSGTPPSKLIGNNVSLPIVIEDKYGDLVNSSIELVFFPSTFTADTISAKLTPGSFADVPLSQFLSNATASGTNPINLTATVKDYSTTSSTFSNRNSTFTSSDWLTFNPGNQSLTGLVPLNGTTTITLNLIALDLVTHAWSRSILTLSTSATVVTKTGSSNTSVHGLSTVVKATIGIVVGCFVGLILLCLLLTCCRRYVAHEKHKIAEEGGIEEKAWRNIRNREADQAVLAKNEAMRPSPIGIVRSHLLKMREFGFPQHFDTKHPSPDDIIVVGTAELGVRHSPALQDQQKVGVKGATDSIAMRTRQWLAAATNGVGSIGRHGGLSTLFGRKGAEPGARSPRKSDITNPVIQRSLSNAAYQAQLALTINTAEIAARSGGSTYAYGTRGIGRDYASSLGPGPSGLGGNDDGYSGSEESSEGLTGTGTSTGKGTEESDESSRFGMGKSSRASWESEAPFSWTNADRGKAITTLVTNDHHEDQSDIGEMSSDHSQFTHNTHSTNSHEIDLDVPVQRSDFRPVPPPHALPRAPSVMSETEGIDIDNIHFDGDTDNDEDEDGEGENQGEEEEEEGVVIATASRVSPGSDASGRGSVIGEQPGQVSGGRGGGTVGAGVTYSRLVNFGKQKTVVVMAQCEATGESTSQTAVISSVSGTTNGSPGSRLVPGGGSPKVVADIDGSKVGSIRGEGAASRSTGHRVLLGVSEHFHFYPPLYPEEATRLAMMTSRKGAAGKPILAAFIERSESPKKARGTIGRSGGGAGAGIVVEPLPNWLHYDEGEMWGVPPEKEKGFIDVRIVERGSVGGDKVIGRFTIEVVGRH